MRNRKEIYYLYNRDSFIDVGTIAELSERQHLKKSSIYSYIARSKNNENTSPLCRRLERD